MKIAALYTTEYGSVTTILESLKKEVHHQLDLFNIIEVAPPNVASYDAILLGGSIHMGKLQREMGRFIKKNMETIQTVPLYLFVCSAETKDTTAYFQTSFPEVILEKARDRFTLGGEIVLEKLTGAHRLILKMVGKASDFSSVSQEELRRFAETLNSLKD